MKKIFLGFLLLAGLVGFSQAPKAMNSAEILLKMKKLNVLGKVLYIAAHPDDENTRLLAFLANDRLYRTGYLSLTRGDGGQNLIGDEQGVELGLIRTQELLAARRIDGAEQFFSRAYDFGFSKTSDETLKFWDKEKVLSDVVWVIRNFQPDVIITRFPEDARAGHGHHAASGILGREAYEAAADSTRFPEQFQYGVKPWRAKRIVWNTFNFGGANTIDSSNIRLDVGTYNSLLGKSYGEMAAESRSQHKSQGFGVPSQRGEQFEFFKMVNGQSFKTDFMDDVPTNWSSIGYAEVQKQVDTLQMQYNFSMPSASLSRLVKIYKLLEVCRNDYWREMKQQEVKQLIAACAGLYLEASTSQANVVHGDTLRINLVANNRNGVEASLENVKVFSQEEAIGKAVAFLTEQINKPLQKNKNLSLSKFWVVPDAKSISQPYWLANGMPDKMFDVRNQKLIGDAESAPAYSVAFNIKIEEETFSFVRPLRYKFTDPVKGELFQPLYVLPRLELKYSADNYIAIKGKPIKTLLNYHNNSKDSADYGLQNISTKNWILNNPTSAVKMAGGANIDVATMLVVNNTLTEKSKLNSLAKNGNQNFDVYKKEIHYDHIPYVTYFSKAQTNLINIDLNVVGKNIGYIVGAGDKVPQALEQMGYTVTLLTLKDITAANIKQFDAIITGVRAYNVHEWMNSVYDVLMQYVQNGGNLIVQYNTSNTIGPVKAKMAPYNFNISRDRVTDETAPIEMSLPQHPVLHFPNKITDKDFEGWVQERSIYMAKEYDTAFATPFRMKDPTEKESSNGSLLIAKYGKGNFVYTGLVFFRELPAGVPGAYRLMANLIALGKKKQ